jgi:membrane protease YdiL (CAAX protease family)
VIKRSFWSLLLASTALELLVFYRPTFALAEPTLSLLMDLAFQTVLLLGLPAVWLKLVGHRWSEVGLAWPAARTWRWLALAAVVLLPAALLATRIPSIHAAYPRLTSARAAPWLLVPSTLAFAVYGLGWEFFFRGFLLRELAAYVGRWAIIVQAIPCTLMHLGKPTPELVAAFPAAIVFGAMAYRLGSVLPGWLLHVLVALVINLGCLFWPLP